MDAISSFFKNIKDKLTNPFFGTLALVLLVQHWELVFSVFNFDKDCTLTDRLYFIQNYISQNISLKNFVFDVLRAAGIMLIGYVVVILTRSIVIWIEHSIMPTITKKIVSDNVVLKTLHDSVVEERDTNFKKYEEQRDKVLEYSSLIDKQQKQLTEKDENILKLNERIISNADDFNIQLKNSEEILLKDLKSTKDECTAQLELFDQKFKKEVERNDNFQLELQKIFFSEKTKNFHTLHGFPPIIQNKYNQLVDNNVIEPFIRIVKSIEQEESVKPNKRASYRQEFVSNYINLGLFTKDSNTFRIEISILGKMIYAYRNMLN